MDSLLGGGEAWTCQIGITAQKGRNFQFDLWIALKVVEEFLNVVFVGGPIESLLVLEQVWSRHTRIRA